MIPHHNYAMSAQITRHLGRPSKGDRVDLFTRVPRSLAEVFVEDAAAAGKSQSDQMALILTSWYESRPPRLDTRGRGQDAVFVTAKQRRGRRDSAASS